MTSTLPPPKLLRCRSLTQNITLGPTFTPLEWACSGLTADDFLSISRQQEQLGPIVIVKRGNNVICTALYNIDRPFINPDRGFKGNQQLSRVGRDQVINLSSNDDRLQYSIHLRDEYKILYYVDVEIKKQRETDTTGAVIQNITSLSINPNGISLNTDLVEIPSITMSLQTDLRGNNLNEAAFDVFDNIFYCSNYPPTCSHSNNCIDTVSDKRTQGCPIDEIPENKLRKTEYSIIPFKFNRVVRGRGCTLREKSAAINDTELDVDDFMLRLCVFGMLKYILARMMTGQFKLKWLLNRNEDEFFDQLRNSRLCRFREAFDDPTIKGYGKYFR